MMLNPFVNQPYTKCPKCSEDYFGVLSIGDGFYTRRCAKCNHPKGTERAMSYPLPELNKKIVYLDQFVISNMVKALTVKPEDRTDSDNFFFEVFKKLDRLSKLQLIICPDSDFHETESFFSKFPKEHKRVYELLSHGVSYYDMWTILRFEVETHLENWLSGHPNKETDLTVDRVVHGKINAWQERLIISINSQRMEMARQGIVETRQRSHEILKQVYDKWSSDRGKNLDYWYKDELAAWKTTILNGYFDHLKKATEYYFGNSQGLNPLVLLPTPLYLICDNIIAKFKAKYGDGDEFRKKVDEFLSVESLEHVPFIRIYCMLLAAVAHRLSCGNMNKDKIRESFFTDVFISSTLLPFCDVIFLEKQVAGFLRESPLSTVLNKMPSIFSMSNKDEFLAHLDEIEQSASVDHLNAVKEVYGDEWGTPYCDVLRNS